MENIPNELSAEEAIKQERMLRKKEIINLAFELSGRPEAFIFSGISGEDYEKMKATDAEYPGMTTPVEEIVARMEKEGMKVALGKHPESGSVFILPSQSNDIEMDSISPTQLDAEKIEDATLKRLVLLMKEVSADKR